MYTTVEIVTTQELNIEGGSRNILKGPVLIQSEHVKTLHDLQRKGKNKEYEMIWIKERNTNNKNMTQK